MNLVGRLQIENGDEKVYLQSKNSNEKRRIEIYQITCYLIWAMIVIIASAKINLGGADDAANTQLNASYSLIEWCVYRYNTWSARVVNEFIGYICLQHTFIWRVLNGVILFFIPVLMNFLSDTRGVLSMVLFMCIPVGYIAEVGWISTTTGYFFIAFFALIAMCFVKLYLQQKEPTLLSRVFCGGDCPKTSY